MDKSLLKPCPVCGCGLDVFYDTETNYEYSAGCQSCSFQSKGYSTKQELFIDWRASTRPSKDEYYLNIAEVVMSRSTCLRRKYGSVIVKNDEIIATGYNGSPRGDKNCCDIGECWREEYGIPHGQRYELCCAVHSEANAIISASRRDMQGAVLYLASDKPKAEPCDICKRLIKNAGITKVITREKITEVKS